MGKLLIPLGGAILDKRQSPSKAIVQYYQPTLDNSKYKPHTGTKQLKKAEKRALRDD